VIVAALGLPDSVAARPAPQVRANISVGRASALAPGLVAAGYRLVDPTADMPDTAAQGSPAARARQWAPVGRPSAAWVGKVVQGRPVAVAGQLAHTAPGVIALAVAPVAECPAPDTAAPAQGQVSLGCLEHSAHLGYWDYLGCWGRYIRIVPYKIPSGARRRAERHTLQNQRSGAAQKTATQYSRNWLNWEHAMTSQQPLSRQRLAFQPVSW